MTHLLMKLLSTEVRETIKLHNIQSMLCINFRLWTSGERIGFIILYVNIFVAKNVDKSFASIVTLLSIFYRKFNTLL